MTSNTQGPRSPRSSRRRTMPDLTPKEWLVVNEALALLEVHLDDYIEEGSRTQRDLRHLEHLREKVLDRIRR